jgi:hypothetical protein
MQLKRNSEGIQKAITGGKKAKRALRTDPYPLEQKSA